jgi:1,2-diacylglycerol 3-beta-glucosyltransferase
MSRILLLTQVLFIIGIIAIEVVAALGLVYQYILLLAGGRRWAKGSPPGMGPHLRIAVALPAHNEERVIGHTVGHLLNSTYPRPRFDVHVVADYCGDDTAASARLAGAVVHVRREGLRGRKGYALGWLFDRLLASPAGYDAFVVFDADSDVAPDFLSHANRALLSGADVVQGRHLIANPSASRFSALADADMRLNNRLRNQAKANLGLSARLMGDGMCFRREVLEMHPWSQATSLTEDREYGIYLATRGVRVQFAPQAVSSGEAVALWRDADPQRLRWYGGVFEMQRQYVGPLLAAALRRRDMAALDLALELLLPPFSMLVLMSVAVALAGGALTLVRATAWSVFAVGLVLTAAAALFPFLGLLLEGAPARTLRALAYGPFYAVWRVGISVRVGLKRGNVTWVRTRRNEETRAD